MQTLQPSFKGSWYPGLDGVRAIAVLMVFLFHTVAILTLGLGWAGVQVFFVLSGFLITGILYDNRDKPHRWRNFYARRTLRIFPLFFFVWLVLAVFTPIIHLQWHPSQLFWPLYLGNYISFFVGTNEMRNVYSPVLHHAIGVGHFWSLAVEEQFYVIWPLVVFLVADRRKLIRICQFGIVGVLLLRIVLVQVVPDHLLKLGLLNKMTFTQADAFLIGGLLALWIRGPERDRLIRWSSPLLVGAFTGFAVLAAVHLRSEHFFIDSAARRVSTLGFTLLDTTSAGLILSAMKPGTLVYRVCTLPFFRRLGIYSYGFYVYHILVLSGLLYPIHAILHHVSRRWWYPLDALYFVFAFLVTFGLAALSYHYLEMPFLSFKGRFSEEHRNPQLLSEPQTARSSD